MTTTARRHIRRDPPDCLLITPESLEVMLVSPNVDSRGLFCNLRVVIVDEIHGFAGDDRGWHLLSVLQRITRLAGREQRRIGLSATVRNPELLWEEQGILGIGQKGEETYGRRHFLELLSVFLSPPLFAVLHGRQELGFVDELTFMGKQDGSRVLLLGGRAWRVTYIDWQRKVAHVEVSEDRGRTRWKGQGQGLSFRLCQAIQRVLARDGTQPWWSQRAQDRLREIRGEYAWLRPQGSVVVASPDSGTESL